MLVFIKAKEPFAEGNKTARYVQRKASKLHPSNSPWEVLEAGPRIDADAVAVSGVARG